jgi:hypothetical protein
MRTTARILLSIGLAVAASGSSLPGAAAEHRADWLRDAKWGVMSHYLADWIAAREQVKMDVDRWNRLIDAFDAERLAKQLASVRAGYYQITIGQNSGYYLAPNATYDQLVGITPSRCSQRDLVAELSDSLQSHGIPLLVYLPSGAPGGDRAAVAALQWEQGPHPNREFQAKWERVIRAWSLRWGDRVSGWWFDGCYWPNSMYRDRQSPNFASFAAAARAGNPASIVAFNPGVYLRIISLTPDEDFTAGETNDPASIEFKRLDDGRRDGTQLHVLSYLGQTWGRGEPRFTADQIVEWSRRIWDQGGAVTWDVPLQSDGTIAQPFLAQLRAIGEAARTPRPAQSPDYQTSNESTPAK